MFLVAVPVRRDLVRLAQLVDDGALRVFVAQRFPLVDGRAAFASRSTARRAPGKTVLTVP